MYAVELDPVALHQAEALPVEAINQFLELRALLEVQLWSGGPVNPDNPKGNLLTHVFADLGLIVYLVLEEQRVVHIVRVEWLG